MSDIKISLPGSETVTLTGQTIDKLIRAGDGDAVLLYLYILKTNGQKTSSEAAIALDKSKGWVASAMAVLSRLGLVQLDHHNVDVDAGTQAADNVEASTPPPKEPRQYTEREVQQEILSGSDFTVVIDETQRRLGKILTQDDMLRLYGIYDTLRLPPEVILQLITHCINESRITGDGRAPNVKYIERAAFTWEREGIFTLERAEEYLKALEERKSIQGEMKRALRIRDREFSATEKRYVDNWIHMGVEPEAIEIAYDKTVTKTGNLAWPYIDTIVKNWHSKGLHTAQEVKEKDASKRQSNTGGYKGDSTQKHGEPNSDDIERAKRLLNKIKDE